MPVYEYNCVECEEKLEVTRSFNDPEIIPPCQSCGYSMVRVYTPAGIQFKGSGFYKTDNGR
jgi:putative FmdB family regulatory protein